MKRLALILTMILAAGFAHAQPAAAPAPTGLVVGSGNYFSPIVADLEKAIAFYGAIGFQFQGAPSQPVVISPQPNLGTTPNTQPSAPIGVSQPGMMVQPPATQQPTITSQPGMIRPPGRGGQ